MNQTIKGITFTVFFLFFTVIFSSCGSGKGLVMGESKADVVTEEEAGLFEDTEETLSSEEATTATLFVYVCGAVAEPGVYELPEGARIYEAVDAAGGMTEDAATESMNLASNLEDGMQIRILTKDEAAAELALAMATEDAEGRLNLNTASKEQLMTLPGVGESKAQNMIDYREEHGGFTSAEEVMNITGIKEGVFAKFKDKVYVK